MKFNIIIATYNRRESLRILIEQILECSDLPEKIIIVDSSIDENQEAKSFDRVVYIRSSHSNQPYQRYLGCLASNHDILVYFDDDMRIVDKQCFKKILAVYANNDVVGVQPNFVYEHNFFNYRVPKSKTRQLAKNNITFKFLKTISGNPNIKNGKFWLAGIRGKNPDNGKSLEWFNGPVFSARKKFLYRNFNFNLFDLYRDKMGKAEDAILGFTLSDKGSIVYLKDNCFYHDDQDDSTYSADLISFGKRVAYSRLYLSFEYARLLGKSKILVFLHFNLYIFGRIISMLINQIIHFNATRGKIITGYLQGYLKAISDVRYLCLHNSGSYWRKEAESDIKYKAIPRIK
jgi:glycosyltransferase involved in cell wall biosynthesis